MEAPVSESSLIKLQPQELQLYQKQAPAQFISFEIYEIFKSTLFYRTSPVAAS